MLTGELKYKILVYTMDANLIQTIINCLHDKADISHSKAIDSAHSLPSENSDLIILDIDDSKANYTEWMDKIKKANRFASVLILAQNLKIDFILRAMKQHVGALLFKPLNLEDFSATSMQLLTEAREKKEKNKKIVLAIGAHPDDVEFGCGGNLMKLHAEGSDITIVTLSLGARGGNPTVRKKEAQAAAKLLGAKLFLGDFPDTRISNGIETIQYLENIIHQVRPTHVYIHSPNDSHQDHKNTYQASIIACRAIPNLFGYLSPSSTVEFRPNIFVHIDDYIDKKVDVLSIYASQIESKPYLHPDMIKATARYWGRFSDYRLVEPMEVINAQA